MRIIEPGDVSKKLKWKTFVCSICGCIFEANQDEYTPQQSQYIYTDYVCNCPTCGEKTSATINNWKSSQ